MILHGREAGEAAVPAAVGTLARIVDFYTMPDGLLGIRAEGGERFHVDRSRVRDNGLAHGSVRFWESEPALELPPEYGLLGTILERLFENPAVNSPRRAAPATTTRAGSDSVSPRRCRWKTANGSICCR